MSDALDIQVGGNHYKGFKIQPVEFSTVNGLSFIQGSMLKYLCRYNKPGGKGIQDLDKIIHYAELAKHFLTTTDNNPQPVEQTAVKEGTAAQSPMTLHTFEIAQWAGLNLLEFVGPQLPNTSTAFEVVDTLLKKVNGLQPVPLAVLLEAYVAVVWTTIKSGVPIDMFDVILVHENAACLRNNNGWPGSYARVEDQIAIYVTAIRDVKYGANVKRISAALGPVLYYLLTKINEECSGPAGLQSFCKELLQKLYAVKAPI